MVDDFNCCLERTHAGCSARHFMHRTVSLLLITTGRTAGMAHGLLQWT